MRECLIKLKLNKDFIEKNINSKARADEGLPIAYNPYLLQNHIKERVEEDLVDYYSDYCNKIKGLTEITDKISKTITHDTNFTKNIFRNL